MVAWTFHTVAPTPAAAVNSATPGSVAVRALQHAHNRYATNNRKNGAKGE